LARLKIRAREQGTNRAPELHSMTAATTPIHCGVDYRAKGSAAIKVEGANPDGTPVSRSSLVIMGLRSPSARSSLESTQYRSVTTNGMFWGNVSSGGFRQDKVEPLGSASVYWKFGLHLLKGNCLKVYGGETGIRTLDTLSSMPPFQGGTFNHSAISPHPSRAFLNLPQLKAVGTAGHILRSLRIDVLLHICAGRQIQRDP
jgi:hypothetical protein